MLYTKYFSWLKGGNFFRFLYTQELEILMRKCRTSWKTVPAIEQRTTMWSLLFKNKKAKFSAALSPAEQRALDQVRIHPPERKSLFFSDIEHPPGWCKSPGYSKGCILTLFKQFPSKCQQSQQGFTAVRIPFSGVGICTDQALYWNESSKSLSGHQGSWSHCIHLHNVQHFEVVHLFLLNFFFSLNLWYWLMRDEWDAEEN